MIPVKTSDRNPTKEGYYFGYRDETKGYPQVTFWYADKGWSSKTEIWLDESPSGANVLVEQINKITEAKRLYGCSTDNTDDDALIAANGFNQCLSQVKFLVAQYNAVEPEKDYKTALEETRESLSELIRSMGRIENGSPMKDFDKDRLKKAKATLAKYWEGGGPMIIQSQSPQTPIDREQEGKRPLFYIKHLAEGWTGAVLESEKMEDWRLGWLNYDVIDNPNGTDILGGSIAAVEIFQSGKYDYSSSFPIITRK